MKYLLIVIVELIFSLLLLTANCFETQINNIKITSNASKNKTDFTIASPLSKELSLKNAWLAFGFNSEMSPTNTIICKSTPTNSSVEHYYNKERVADLLVSSNALIGITGIKVNVQNGVLTCSFSRENKINVPNYFEITDSTESFLIAAYGPISKENKPEYHVNRGVSSNKIKFS